MHGTMHTNMVPTKLEVLCSNPSCGGQKFAEEILQAEAAVHVETYIPSRNPHHDNLIETSLPVRQSSYRR